MAISYWYAVICDGCAHRTFRMMDSEAAARRELRAEGWLRKFDSNAREKLDFCPVCAIRLAARPR